MRRLVTHKSVRSERGRVRRGALLIDIGVLAALLLGCSNGDPDDQDLGLATGSPSSTSPEDEAERAAEELVATFYTVEAQVRSDPRATISKLGDYDSVAIGPRLRKAKEAARLAAGQLVAYDGVYTVVSATAVAVDLNNERGVEPGSPNVVVHACVDATTATVTDGDGEVIEPPSGVISLEWDIRNYEYPDPQGWRVWDYEGSDEQC